ncbi:MAG: Do family serine endopeptidase [Candidatus Latescibacterota bacterium]
MKKTSPLSMLILTLIISFLALPSCSRMNQANAQAVLPINEALAEIAARTVNSVVNVSSIRRIDAPGRGESPFGQDIPGPRTQRGMGSGVVVSNDGLIVTNNHVVSGATELRVTANGGRQYQVQVLGTDPMTDVAVLRIKGDPGDLRPISFGSSADLRLGEMVLAIGNPLGLSHTVTMGIVSAKGRAGVGIVEYEDFIQTDAAINPGNSGGALINMRGELIGINTAIASGTGGYQGIGFAIPSDMVRPIMESLVKTGRVTRGFLGVGIQTLTPELARSLNLKATRGVVVSSVQEDSPAARAGIQRYDVILAVDGRETNSAAELRNYIALQGPNKQVALRINRDGGERSVNVTLSELPTRERQARQPSPGQGEPETQGIGLSVTELNASVRHQFSIPETVRSGVVVAGVLPGSNAEEAGFMPGDVILEVARKPVSTVAELRNLILQAQGVVSMLVWRQGSTFLVSVEKS